jgi:hypothetical protein
MPHARTSSKARPGGRRRATRATTGVELPAELLRQPVGTIVDALESVPYRAAMTALAEHATHRLTPAQRKKLAAAKDELRARTGHGAKRRR